MFCWFGTLILIFRCYNDTDYSTRGFDCSLSLFHYRNACIFTFLWQKTRSAINAMFSSTSSKSAARLRFESRWRKREPYRRVKRRKNSMWFSARSKWLDEHNRRNSKSRSARRHQTGIMLATLIYLQKRSSRANALCQSGVLSLGSAKAFVSSTWRVDILLI